MAGRNDMSPDFDVGTDIARHVGTPTPRSRDQPEPRQRTATAQTALSLFAQLLTAATEPTTVQTLCAAPDPVRLAPNVKQKVIGFYSLDDLLRSVTPLFLPFAPIFLSALFAFGSQRLRGLNCHHIGAVVVITLVIGGNKAGVWDSPATHASIMSAHSCSK